MHVPTGQKLSDSILMKPLFYLTILFQSVLSAPGHGQPEKNLSKWQEGYLDIHHINTARGNATFFVFPDGTTMLFDAGAKKLPRGKEHEYFPVPPRDSLSPGILIANYIRQMVRSGKSPQLDYAVISHFHNDHYGQVDSTTDNSKKGNYRLSGITEVGDQLPIGTLIDRGSPDYLFPVDLKNIYRHDETFLNYLAFIRDQQARNGMATEGLIAGRKDQIRLRIHPERFETFHVRNIKANATIWSGDGNTTFEYPFDPFKLKVDEVDENAMSLVLKVSYGPFDYFTGGDLTGYTQWGDFDLETPVAKVVGEVEALALNHHGYYDASNAFFLRTLSPQVVVHQVIHDPHYQPGVLKRLAAHPSHVFTYNMHDQTRKKYSSEVSKLYKSQQGHIVIRVLPGGKQFYVYTLDDQKDNCALSGQFGPYTSDPGR